MSTRFLNMTLATITEPDELPEVGQIVRINGKDYRVAGVRPEEGPTSTFSLRLEDI